MRIHRVYCKSLAEPNNIFYIYEPQSKHLIKALRLKEDDLVEVFDGNGRSAKCKILQITKKNCQLEKISKLNNDVGPKRVLTAVIPFIKKNDPDLVILNSQSFTGSKTIEESRMPSGIRSIYFPEQNDLFLIF